MEEQYEYDDFLFTALTHKAKPTTLNNIKDLFNVLYKIDNHKFSTEYGLELDVIEDEMKNQFLTEEENLGDDLVDSMVRILIDKTIRYFYKLGISINRDITLSTLLDIVSAYYSLITIDIDLIEIQINVMDNEDLSLTETLPELLNNFTKCTIDNCYMSIESVDYSFYDMIRAYYKTLYKVGNKDDEMLNRLLNLNSKYRQTNIIKNFLRDGYEENVIEVNIDEMYSYIEKEDINMIPFEVVATMFLSSDTRLKIEESIDKYFNIESLNLTVEEETLISNEIEKLVYEIEKRL